MTNYKQPAAQADHTENHLEMAGRWYMVNKMGMATLCTDKDGAEKEAADAQRFWPHMGPHRAVQLVEAADVEALRARSVEPAGEYPALPVPVFESWAQGGLLREAGFTADQMRAYVDADRAMRAAQPAPENIRSILARCRDFIDTAKAPAYPAGADLADEIDALLAAQPAPQQKVQEPVAVPRFNCWSTNEGDSWFDHPADSQAIYDCLGNNAKVGDEYELTAGWESVTARYRITGVVGDGEEYEVECISHPRENTAPQPSPASQAGACEPLIRQMRYALALPCDRWNATQSRIVREAIDAADAWLEGKK